MAYESLNEFTEWCYNKYVEYTRKNDFIRSSIYEDVLKNHLQWNLKGRRLVTQRHLAKFLVKNIYKAHIEGKTDKLTYTGEKGKKEFEDEMTKYEELLRKENFPDDSIRELVIMKREQYGT
ncbi:TPA: hypothetical protein NEG48_003084 [Elizabethkingia anophelis]|nr:hypothetical protein [Elizabethkingia anophelis]